MSGYNYDTWYSKDAIDNINSLKNMIRQYRVTYDRDDQTFIIHQDASALPDMEFRMHKSGIHMLYPDDKNNMILMNKVEENMKAFTKFDIKGAKASRKLYAKLLYPSNAYFKWLIIIK